MELAFSTAFKWVLLELFASFRSPLSGFRLLELLGMTASQWRFSTSPAECICMACTDYRNT